MIFLDLNGLPGSGKTTVCYKTIELLVNENVILFQDFIDSKIKTNFDSVMLFLKGILYFKFNEIFDLIKLFFSLPSKLTIKIKRIYLLMINYILYIECQKECYDKIVISEQCFVQEIISCYHDVLISDLQLISRLVSFLKSDYIVINTIIPLDVEIERICARSHGESRLDNINKEAIKRIISVQNDNFDIVREAVKSSRLSFFDIDMMQPPKVNASKIRDFVTEIKEKINA